MCLLLRRELIYPYPFNTKVFLIVSKHNTQGIIGRYFKDNDIFNGVISWLVSCEHPLAEIDMCCEVAVALMVFRLCSALVIFCGRTQWRTFDGVRVKQYRFNIPTECKYGCTYYNRF